MTIEELQAATDQEFKFIALDKDDNIKFAVPIPGEKAWQFDSEQEAESFLWDSEEIEACEEAWEKYIKTLTGKKNRTRKQAERAGAITTMPEFIALPTIRKYQYAISTVNDPVAHLQPVTPDLADNLHFDNGILYFKGVDASLVDLTQYYDKQCKAVSNLDLMTLRALYSVILQDFYDTTKGPEKVVAQDNGPQYLSHNIKIYLTDFLRMLGYNPNVSKDGLAFAVNKIMSYNRILGVMRESQENTRHYPVMQSVVHSDKDNTIQFSSPYINKLIIAILQASIRTDKKGNPKLKTNGEADLRPSHSYLVKSSIAKERNKRAAEIVCVIVTLIEQTGNGIPHIKMQTIIDRCPDLKNALDAAATSSDRGKIVRRAFSKALKLLRDQTRLKEVYKNIQFPSVIPPASYRDFVFTFPHDGKTKKKNS